MPTTLSKGDTSNIRTFLAIELPARLRPVFDGLAEELAPHAGCLKIVAPELVHLTVRFLGGVPSERIPEVEKAAQEAANRVARFRLTLAGVDAFPPNRGRPRVLWVGIEPGSGADALHRLFLGVEDALETRGFGRDPRGLSPHLTIARVREGVRREELGGVIETLVRMRSAARGRFEVGALTVMRSDLSPRGPSYTPLARSPLGG
jgi:2'-5' RNA ligase